MNIFDYNKKKERLQKITKKLEQPNIWNTPAYAKKLTKEYSSLQEDINKINKLTDKLENINILLELIIETNDEEVLKEITFELDKVNRQIEHLEFCCMFSKKNDHANCYLDVQSGSGGIEAQDWANILMRMYLRWAESKGFKTNIIEEFAGEIVGIKSVTIKVSGKYAYGWLRTETGIHRLVRKSPFDSNGRRHTSFSSVFVYPEIQDDAKVMLNLNDLRIDVYRASGAGGQHVNCTESAVRITHIPSGITTQCQNNRSQHQNKEQAIKQIKAKLHAMKIQKKNANKQEIENNKLDIRWGNQIRSYILDDSRVKDLRTGIELSNIQSVFDGNLNSFIKASLKAGL